MSETAAGQHHARQGHRRNHALGHGMPRPTLIHRPSAIEIGLHAFSPSYGDALAVLMRAFGNPYLMPELRRIASTVQLTGNDHEIIEKLPGRCPPG